MNDKSEIAVLIAGAGPCGLILALTLAKNGVPVRIVEKLPKFPVGTRAPGIHPRTLEVFDFLGIANDVVGKAAPLPVRCVYEMPGGTKVAKYHDAAPYQQPTPSVPYKNMIFIMQSNNEAIMRKHLADHNVHVELNTELVDFEQNADGVVAVVVHKNGNAETRETIIADYLVGAEGAKSVVRKKLGLTFLGETRSTEGMVAGDIEVHNIDAKYMHCWGDRGACAVFLRPTEDQANFHALIMGSQEQLLPINDRNSLINYIQEVTNRTDLEFGEMRWLTYFRPNIRMANKFSEGRGFVVGDSAHVHSPVGGQGLNSGVQDSFNLGWKLALIYKGLAPRLLLDSYSTERLPVIAEMLQITTKLHDTTIRHRTDAGGNKGWDLPQFLNQLGVNCRTSPFVVDEQSDAAAAAQEGAYLGEHPTELFAGDRAPNATGLRVVAGAEGDTTSLFKTFGCTHHTALLFAIPTNEAEILAVAALLGARMTGTFKTVVVLPQGTNSAVAEKYPGAHVLEDTGGHAAEAYPPVAAAFPVVIVRPDGVVGAVVRGAEGVKRYLVTVFAD